MTQFRNRTRRAAQAGFTLIELMVVLVIIGVLAALIVPNVLDRADDARATAARTDVNNLMQALKLYKLDNQRYPSSEQGLQALVAKPTAAPAAPATTRPEIGTPQPCTASSPAAYAPMPKNAAWPNDSRPENPSIRLKAQANSAKHSSFISRVG